MDKSAYEDIKRFIDSMFDTAMTPKEESDEDEIEIGYALAEVIKQAKGEEASLIYKAKILEKTLKRIIEMLEEAR